MKLSFEFILHVVDLCDGFNVLEISRYKGIDKISPNTKHCDIISTIKKLRMVQLINVTCKHIQKHQYDVLDFKDLERFVQLNVMMDCDAKSLALSISRGEITTHFYYSHQSHPQLMKSPLV